MPYGDPPGWQEAMFGAYRPQFWPPLYHYQPEPWGYRYTKTITTTGTDTQPVAVPVDEERIRKIVREEIAELPIQFDVPDAPPEKGTPDGGR